MEPPITALQKTAPPPQATPRPLIDRAPTWILRWAHGRLHSRRSSLGESVDSSPRRSCSRLDNSLQLKVQAVIPHERPSPPLAPKMPTPPAPTTNPSPPSQPP